MEKVQNTENLSFACNFNHLPAFHCPYHVHPEYEIVYVEKSSGRRIIAGCMEPFAPGDLMLIGANVPHMYLNEPDPTGEFALAYTIQFRLDAFGPGFFSIPEMSGVRRLLALSERGLAFEDPFRGEIIARIKSIFAESPARRVLGLLETLQYMAEQPGNRALARSEYKPEISTVDTDRVNRIVCHLSTHLHEQIYLEDLAMIVGLTKESFSRFFRRVSQKTFTEFVNELRVCKARQLLIQTNHPVAEIATRCGFNDISNFIKRFTAIEGVCPSDYRRNMLLVIEEGEARHQRMQANGRFTFSKG